MVRKRRCSVSDLLARRQSIACCLLAVIIAVLTCCSGHILAERAPQGLGDLGAGYGLSHHLATSLEELYRSHADGGMVQASSIAERSQITLLGDRVRVVAHVRDAQVDLSMYGFEEEVRSGFAQQGLVPISQLMTLASRPEVELVRPPLRPLAMGQTSEGVALLGASAWHTAGYQGSGMDVAILDLGFQGYASLLGDDLPAVVDAHSARADSDIEAGERHGTGCAEIVADMVPAASLSLVNFQSSVEFMAAVDYAIAQDVDVVSCSIGWPLGGPGDGTYLPGSVSEKVVEATNNGILWVNSAGNQALRHWMGPWNDPDGDVFLEYVGTDDRNTIVALPGDVIRVSMRWDDAWGAATRDFELALFDSTHNKLIWTRTPASGPGDPTRFLAYTVTTAGYYGVAVIRHDGGSDGVRIELCAYEQDLQYSTAESSLAVPADLAEVFTVGAVYFAADALIEPYSSQGPNLGGLIKPDVVAPDGVANTTYLSDGGFFGTSASCPHIAGLAALVMEANPSFMSGQTKAHIRYDLCQDRGAPGPDNVYGYGLPVLGVPGAGPTMTPWPTSTPMPSPTPTQTPDPATSATPTSVHSLTPTMTEIPPPTVTHTPTPTATPTGEIWHQIGLVGRNVSSVSVSSGDGDVVVAGTNDGAHTVHISEDGGVTWRESWPCVTACDIHAVAQDGLVPSIIYAASEDKLFRSEDLGYHWDYVRVRAAPFSKLSGLGTAAGRSGRVYVTGWEACESIFVTGDAGEYWDQRQSPDLCSYGALDSTIVVSAEDADKLYVARAHDRPEVFRSEDGGMHWTLLGLLGAGAGVHDLSLGAYDDDLVYAATFGFGVYVSVDGGGLWRSRSGGLPTGVDGIDVTAICADPRDSLVAYAAVRGYGLYATTDGGMWWEPFAHLPGWVTVHDLTMVSGMPWRIWAATDDGVWMYEWPGFSLPLVVRSHLVPTVTPIPSTTPTATETPTITLTPTESATPTVTPTGSATAPVTPTPTWTSIYPGPGTPTVTATATPVPSVTPTGALPATSDLIVDGGFEGGWGWVLPATPRSGRYSLDGPRMGLWSMQLGILPAESLVWAFSPAYQVVTIPAGATRATLRFWWKRSTEESYTYSSTEPPPALLAQPLTIGMMGYTDDCHEALLLAEDMQTVLSFVSRGLANDTGWVLVERDLLPWRGRKVVVYFDAYNHTDLSQRTWMYVDDVSLEVDVP